MTDATAAGRICAECGKPMPALRGAGAIYCSRGCNRKAYRGGRTVRQQGRLTDAQKADIARRYRRGEKPSEIARALNESPNRVWGYIRYHVRDEPEPEPPPQKPARTWHSTFIQPPTLAQLMAGRAR